MADGRPMKALSSGEEGHDPFANFVYNPPKPRGPFRSLTRRNKYRAMAGLPPATNLYGSNSSLASLSGSSQNLLDPSKMMSMQEEAKSRSITAAVMKNRLYESVISTPRRRRFSVRADYQGPSSSDACEIQGFHGFARMVQSLPVTPAHSQTVTPATSPKSKKKFTYGFYSHNTSPVCMTPEEENMAVDEAPSDRGLASIFSPQPRFVAATRQSVEDVSMEAEDDSSFLSPDVLSPSSSGFKHPGALGLAPKRMRRARSPISNQDVNVIAPNNF